MLLVLGLAMIVNGIPARPLVPHEGSAAGRHVSDGRGRSAPLLRSRQPAYARLHGAGGRVGRRPIPQGRAAPFRRPVQPGTIQRGSGRSLRPVTTATASAKVSDSAAGPVGTSCSVTPCTSAAGNSHNGTR